MIWDVIINDDLVAAVQARIDGMTKQQELNRLSVIRRSGMIWDIGQLLETVALTRRIPVALAARVMIEQLEAAAPREEAA